MPTPPAQPELPPWRESQRRAQASIARHQIQQNTSARVVEAPPKARVVGAAPTPKIRATSRRISLHPGVTAKAAAIGRRISFHPGVTAKAAPKVRLRPRARSRSPIRLAVAKLAAALPWRPGAAEDPKSSAQGEVAAARNPVDAEAGTPSHVAAPPQSSTANASSETRSQLEATQHPGVTSKARSPAVTLKPRAVACSSSVPPDPASRLDVAGSQNGKNVASDKPSAFALTEGHAPVRTDVEAEDIVRSGPVGHQEHTMLSSAASAASASKDHGSRNKEEVASGKPSAGEITEGLSAVRADDAEKDIARSGPIGNVAAQQEIVVYDPKKRKPLPRRELPRKRPAEADPEQPKPSEPAAVPAEVQIMPRAVGRLPTRPQKKAKSSPSGTLRGPLAPVAKGAPISASPLQERLEAKSSPSSTMRGPLAPVAKGAPPSTSALQELLEASAAPPPTVESEPAQSTTRALLPRPAPSRRSSTTATSEPSQHGDAAAYQPCIYPAVDGEEVERSRSPVRPKPTTSKAIAGDSRSSEVPKQREATSSGSPSKQLQANADDTEDDVALSRGLLDQILDGEVAVEGIASASVPQQKAAGGVPKKDSDSHGELDKILAGEVPIGGAASATSCEPRDKGKEIVAPDASDVKLGKESTGHEETQGKAGNAEAAPDATETKSSQDDRKEEVQERSKEVHSEAAPEASDAKSTRDEKKLEEAAPDASEAKSPRDEKKPEDATRIKEEEKFDLAARVADMRRSLSGWPRERVEELTCKITTFLCATVKMKNSDKNKERIQRMLAGQDGNHGLVDIVIDHTDPEKRREKVLEYLHKRMKPEWAQAFAVTLNVLVGGDAKNSKPDAEPTEEATAATPNAEQASAASGSAPNVPAPNVPVAAQPVQSVPLQQFAQTIPLAHLLHGSQMQPAFAGARVVGGTLPVAHPQATAAAYPAVISPVVLTHAGAFIRPPAAHAFRPTAPPPPPPAPTAASAPPPPPPPPPAAPVAVRNPMGLSTIARPKGSAPAKTAADLEREVAEERAAAAKAASLAAAGSSAASVPSTDVWRRMAARKQASQQARPSVAAESPVTVAQAPPPAVIVLPNSAPAQTPMVVEPRHSAQGRPPMVVASPNNTQAGALETATAPPVAGAPPTAPSAVASSTPDVRNQTPAELAQPAPAPVETSASQGSSPSAAAATEDAAKTSMDKATVSEADGTKAVPAQDAAGTVSTAERCSPASQAQEPTNTERQPPAPAQTSETPPSGTQASSMRAVQISATDAREERTATATATSTDQDDRAMVGVQAPQGEPSKPSQLPPISDIPAQIAISSQVEPPTAAAAEANDTHGETGTPAAHQCRPQPANAVETSASAANSTPAPPTQRNVDHVAPSPAESAPAPSEDEFAAVQTQAPEPPAPEPQPSQAKKDNTKSRPAAAGGNETQTCQSQPTAGMQVSSAQSSAPAEAHSFASTTTTGTTALQVKPSQPATAKASNEGASTGNAVLQGQTQPAAAREKEEQTASCMRPSHGQCTQEASAHQSQPQATNASDKQAATGTPVAKATVATARKAPAPVGPAKSQAQSSQPKAPSESDIRAASSIQVSQATSPAQPIQPKAPSDSGTLGSSQPSQVQPLQPAEKKAPRTRKAWAKLQPLNPARVTLKMEGVEEDTQPLQALLSQPATMGTSTTGTGVGQVSPVQPKVERGAPAVKTKAEPEPETNVDAAITSKAPETKSSAAVPTVRQTSSGGLGTEACPPQEEDTQPLQALLSPPATMGNSMASTSVVQVSPAQPKVERGAPAVRTKVEPEPETNVDAAITSKAPETKSSAAVPTVRQASSGGLGTKACPSQPAGDPLTNEHGDRLAEALQLSETVAACTFDQSAGASSQKSQVPAAAKAMPATVRPASGVQASPVKYPRLTVATRGRTAENTSAQPACQSPPTPRSVGAVAPAYPMPKSVGKAGVVYPTPKTVGEVAVAFQRPKSAGKVAAAYPTPKTVGEVAVTFQTAKTASPVRVIGGAKASSERGCEPVAVAKVGESSGTGRETSQAQRGQSAVVSPRVNRTTEGTNTAPSASAGSAAAAAKEAKAPAQAQESHPAASPSIEKAAPNPQPKLAYMSQLAEAFAHEDGGAAGAASTSQGSPAPNIAGRRLTSKQALPSQEVQQEVAPAASEQAVASKPDTPTAETQTPAASSNDPPAPPTEAASREQAASSLEPGALMTLHGLSTAQSQEYNGLVVLLQKFDKSRNRWSVRLKTRTGEALTIARPENLRCSSPEDVFYSELTRRGGSMPFASIKAMWEKIDMSGRMDCREFLSRHPNTFKVDGETVRLAL